MKTQNNFFSFSNSSIVVACLAVVFAMTADARCQIRIEHKIEVGGKVRGAVELPGLVHVARLGGQSVVVEGLSLIHISEPTRPY